MCFLRLMLQKSHYPPRICIKPTVDNGNKSTNFNLMLAGIIWTIKSIQSCGLFFFTHVWGLDSHAFEGCGTKRERKNPIQWPGFDLLHGIRFAEAVSCSDSRTEFESLWVKKKRTSTKNTKEFTLASFKLLTHLNHLQISSTTLKAHLPSDGLWFYITFLGIFAPKPRGRFPSQVRFWSIVFGKWMIVSLAKLAN